MFPLKKIVESDKGFPLSFVYLQAQAHKGITDPISFWALQSRKKKLVEKFLKKSER